MMTKNPSSSWCYIKGQALVELSFAVTLLGLLLLWALPFLHAHLMERAERQEQAQIILRQVPWRAHLGMMQLDFESIVQHYNYIERESIESELYVTDDYGLGSEVASLWEKLKIADGLTMPLKNMYSLVLFQPEHEQAWMNFVRLADDWSPSSVGDLVARPRTLTTTSPIDDLNISKLQDTLAHLPMAKELHSDVLKLGHVDIDVVPQSALCEEPECHD